MKITLKVVTLGGLQGVLSSLDQFFMVESLCSDWDGSALFNYPSGFVLQNGFTISKENIIYEPGVTKVGFKPTEPIMSIVIGDRTMLLKRANQKESHILMKTTYFMRENILRSPAGSATDNHDDTKFLVIDVAETYKVSQKPKEHFWSLDDALIARKQPLKVEMDLATVNNFIRQTMKCYRKNYNPLEGVSSGQYNYSLRIRADLRAAAALLPALDKVRASTGFIQLRRGEQGLVLMKHYGWIISRFFECWAQNFKLENGIWGLYGHPFNPTAFLRDR